jgi:hypothetical protein
MEVKTPPKRKKQGKTPKLRRSGRNKANGKYERQRQRTEKNKLRRRSRHFREHPDDTQINELMKNYR